MDEVYPIRKADEEDIKFIKDMCKKATVRKEGAEELPPLNRMDRGYMVRSCKYIKDVLFTSEYDFSDYLSVEKEEIIKSYGPLEQYARDKKEEERRNVMLKARMYDVVASEKMIVKILEGGEVRYEVFDTLESVFLRFLHGRCMLCSTEIKGSIYILSDVGMYCIYRIIRIHRKDDVKKMYKESKENNCADRKLFKDSTISG